MNHLWGTGDNKESRLFLQRKLLRLLLTNDCGLVRRMQCEEGAGRTVLGVQVDPAPNSELATGKSPRTLGA